MPEQVKESDLIHLHRRVKWQEIQIEDLYTKGQAIFEDLEHYKRITKHLELTCKGQTKKLAQAKNIITWHRAFLIGVILGHLIPIVWRFF